MADEAELARLEVAVMQRVAQLRSEGPGDVRVSRVSDISAVRVLRQAKSQLADDEAEWLDEILGKTEQAAFGIQVTGFSRLTQEAQEYRPDIDLSDPSDKAVRRFGALFVGGFGIFNFKRLLTKLFPPRHVARSGAPLPAPETLMLAAEAWLVAEIYGGRAHVDVRPLKEPWESAVVER